MSTPSAPPPRIIGRYALCGEIASGGMGTVQLGRLIGPAGFARTVAVKCLHPHLARDAEFVAMFLDEARLAARVVHPNVVPTIDVVTTESELFVVMEYVQGESLAKLLSGSRARTGRVRVAPPIAAAIVSGVLHGLHAAHETRNEQGEPLGIVHRDVTPHNVLVGIDGVARLLDFGVAKAADRIQTTREGRIKGKLPYMAPEQLRGTEVNRQVDLYAAGVVLWETLAGRRLFAADNEAALLERILFGTIAPPSTVVPEISPALDAVVMRALAAERRDRFATAREMAIALQDAITPAAPNEVGEWVESVAADALADRARRISAIERAPVAAAPVSGSRLAQDLASSSSRSNPVIDSRVAARTLGESTEPHAGTQMSTVSQAVPSGRPPPPARRRRLLALALPAAAAFVALVVYLGVRSGAQSAASKQSAPSPPAPASSAVMAPPPPTTAAPVASSVELKAPSVPVAPVADGGGSHVTPTGRPAHPPANCDPPFVVGPDGVRHYKRECL